MTDDERQQIERLTSRAVERSASMLTERLETVYGEHAAHGRLRSGATIKAAIRQMEALAREITVDLLGSVARVSKTEEAFARIDEAVQSIVGAFGEELLNVARLIGQVPGSSATSAAIGLYRTMKSDIEADLIIARHDFLSGKMRQSESAPKIGTNRGGKPLAAHWDEMWAAIAVQLWSGDLKPVTQADIKRAMLDWFTDRGIEIGDTAVTERARQLWRKIEAAE